jgi:hypothetical protein
VAVPAHDGVRPHEDEVAAPVPAEATGQDPDELIADAERRPFPAGAGEDRQLMAQRQVLSGQVGAATQRGEGPEQEDE